MERRWRASFPSKHFIRYPLNTFFIATTLSKPYEINIHKSEAAPLRNQSARSRHPSPFPCLLKPPLNIAKKRAGNNPPSTAHTRTLFYASENTHTHTHRHSRRILRNPRSSSTPHSSRVARAREAISSYLSFSPKEARRAAAVTRAREMNIK